MPLVQLYQVDNFLDEYLNFRPDNCNRHRIDLPKETVGRVRAVLIEMLTNDNKEDEDIEDEDIEDDDKEDDDKEDDDIEDDDIEDDDVHQLITKQRRRIKS